MNNSTPAPENPGAQFEMTQGPDPKPCTTEKDVRDANPGLAELCPDIDTTRFATTIDRLIIEALATRQLDANPITGEVYNPRTGKRLKASERGNNYLYVAVHLKPDGRVARLPVHRLVYYAACPGIVIGDRFDIHHIDGNTRNNRIENLMKIPREFHSVIGAFTNCFDAEEGYLRFIGRRGFAKGADAYTIKALRYCAGLLPRGSSRKSIIYSYFAEKMQMTHNYCKDIGNGSRGRYILPATPEEEQKIMEEYGWLIETARKYTSKAKMTENMHAH